MAALLCLFCVCGCGVLDYLPGEKLPYAKLAIPYTRTELGRTTTLDVLNIARDPAYQFNDKRVEGVLLTQSDTVVAYSGQSADGEKSWLNVIAFDEFRMTAGRKYFFCVDESVELAPVEPPYYFIPAREGILFDCRFVIDPEVLTTPYATEEAQKIALLMWLAERFEQDIASLVGEPLDPAQGSNTVLVSGMMVGQIFTGLLVELDKSPGLARNLEDERGIAFPHISLGEGRIRMVVEKNVADVKLRVNLPMVAFGG